MLVVQIGLGTVVEIASDDECEDVQVMLTCRAQRAEEAGDLGKAQRYEAEVYNLGKQWLAHKQCRLMPAYTEKGA